MLKFALFLALLLPAAIALPAAATTINASDNSFSVELGNGWQNTSAGMKGEALSARNGKASFTVLAHPVSSEADAAKEVADTLVRLSKEKYVVYGRVQRRKIPSGGNAYFIHYVKNAAERRDGLFLFGGKTWSITSQDMSDIQFTELLDAIFLPDPSVKPAPRVPRSKPTMKTAPPAAVIKPTEEPAPEVLPSEVTAQFELQTVPGIATAPAPILISTVQAAAPQIPAENAQPKDSFRRTSHNIDSPLGAMAAAFDLPGVGAAAVFLTKMWGLYLLICAAMLIYRLWHGRGEKLDLSQQGNTPYPLDAEANIMAAMSMIYAAGDRTGGRYVVICPRKTEHFGITGVALIFAAAPVLHTAGIDALSGPCLFAGIAFFIIGKAGKALYPNRINIFQKTGETVLTVKERKTAAGSHYAVRDRKRRDVAVIRNAAPLFSARHWQLYDCQGNLRAELKEADSATRIWARRVLGHQWGLLRGNYELLDNQGRAAGTFTRENVPKNRFAVSAENIPGIDHRVMLAFILTAEAETPDRAYPWFG